jgi:hypothetical protein
MIRARRLLRALAACTALIAPGAAMADPVSIAVAVGASFATGAAGATAAGVAGGLGFGAALGAAVTSASVLTAAAVGGALAGAQQLLAASAKPRAAAPNVAFSADLPALDYVFGRTRVGGVVAFHAVNEGLGTPRRNVVVVFVLAGHEIDALEEMWDGKTRMWSAAGGWENGYGVGEGEKFGAFDHRLGAPGQTAIPWLAQAVPSKIDDKFRLTGLPHVALQFQNPGKRWPNGVAKNLWFRVRGAKCLDPRTGQRVWTANLPLCAAQFLEWHLGTRELIDDAHLVGQANLADEDVAKKGGGTLKRYELHGSWSSSQNGWAIVADMMRYAASEPVWTGASARLPVNAYSAPVADFGPADLRGPLRIEGQAVAETRFDGVSGVYGPGNRRHLRAGFDRLLFDDFTPGVVAPRLLALDLSQEPEHQRAQRVAMLTLRATRRAKRLAVPVAFSRAAAELAPGDRVTFALPEAGVTGVWEVKDRRVVYGAQPWVEIDALEDGPSFHSWGSDTATQPPNQNDGDMPDPGVVFPPTAPVTATPRRRIEEDGAVTRWIDVAWGPAPDPGGFLDGYVVRWVDDGEEWTQQAPTTRFRIENVRAGVAVSVAVAARNSLGNLSAWVPVGDVLAGGDVTPPPPPTGWSARSEIGAVLLTGDASPAADFHAFQVFSGSTVQSFAQATLVVEDPATTIRVPRSDTQQRRWWIVAVDRSGNASAPFGPMVAGGRLVQDVDIGAAVIGANALKSEVLDLINNDNGAIIAAAEDARDAALAAQAAATAAAADAEAEALAAGAAGVAPAAAAATAQSAAGTATTNAASASADAAAATKAAAVAARLATGNVVLKGTFDDASLGTWRFGGSLTTSSIAPAGFARTLAGTDYADEGQRLALNLAGRRWRASGWAQSAAGGTPGTRNVRVGLRGYPTAGTEAGSVFRSAVAVGPNALFTRFEVEFDGGTTPTVEATAYVSSDDVGADAVLWRVTDLRIEDVTHAYAAATSASAAHVSRDAAGVQAAAAQTARVAAEAALDDAEGAASAAATHATNAGASATAAGNSAAASDVARLAAQAAQGAAAGSASASATNATQAQAAATAAGNSAAASQTARLAAEAAQGAAATHASTALGHAVSASEDAALAGVYLSAASQLSASNMVLGTVFGPDGDDLAGWAAAFGAPGLFAATVLPPGGAGRSLRVEWTAANQRVADGPERVGNLRGLRARVGAWLNTSALGAASLFFRLRYTRPDGTVGAKSVTLSAGQGWTFVSGEIEVDEDTVSWRPDLLAGPGTYPATHRLFAPRIEPIPPLSASAEQLIATKVTAAEARAIIDAEVAAESGGSLATVRALTQAFTDLDGDARALFYLKVDANGRVGSFAMGANDSGSTIRFRADRFTIENDVGGGLMTPFRVEGGTIYLRNVVIEDESLATAKMGLDSATLPPVACVSSVSSSPTTAAMFTVVFPRRGKLLLAGAAAVVSAGASNGGYVIEASPDNFATVTTIQQRQFLATGEYPVAQTAVLAAGTWKFRLRRLDGATTFTGSMVVMLA